ncbi:unnamed protein product, partial [Effrenium voratum]
AFVKPRAEFERGQPVRGRWAPADHVLDELLQEYWNNKEVDGYVTSRSSVEDRSATRCATHKEHKKTGSGKVIHAKEFIGSEALSQRYFFLAELAEAVPELRVLCHDDACHLRKYATKYAEASPLSQRLAFPNMQRLYVIDRLHAANHKDQWGKEHCDADTEANCDLLKGFNSSAAEMTNSVVSRHKFAIRQVKLWTRSFYMHEVLASRNLLSSLARTHSAALFSQAMHRDVGVLGALMVRMAAVQARGRGSRVGRSRAPGRIQNVLLVLWS